VEIANNTRIKDPAFDQDVCARAVAAIELSRNERRKRP
jgi:hypothetical protein